MIPDLETHLQPLFKELKEAILSQAYRVTSYALSDLSTDAMQKIQSVLEKILLQLISIEDTEIQDLALDGLRYICSDSSEAFLIERLYSSDLCQNKNHLYRVGNFFVELYRIRGVDLYTAAQRHANTYVRLFLINKSGHSAENFSLNEIENFLHDDLPEVRYQAMQLLIAHPEKRFVPIYLDLLKDDDVYNLWDDICDALIEVGIPDDAKDLVDNLFQQRDLTNSNKEPDLLEEEPIFRNEVFRDPLVQSHNRPYAEMREVLHLGLNDDNEVVRYEAILGMLENQDPFLDTNFMRILSDSSYQNRILGLRYLSEHRPMQKIGYVVESLFDAYSEKLFEQTTQHKNHEAVSDFELLDKYEQYLKCVMDFLLELKVRSHPNNKVFVQKINQMSLSIFHRLPKYFKIRMITHMQPFLSDQVMDFIIEETRHLSGEEQHFQRFIQIVSTYFGDARMNELLIYLDTQNFRLMGLAILALCKISNQALRYAHI